MMRERSIEEPRSIVMKRIKWLMSVRLLLATFSLGTAALVQLGEGKAYLDRALLQLYALIGIVYVLSLAYSVLMKKAGNLSNFVLLQLLLDVLLISGLIKVTGGAGSDFFLFFYLTIIGAGIILCRRGGFIIASASSILYVAVILIDQPGMEHYVNTSGRIDGTASLLFSLLMKITTFYLVAFLSGLLAEQVRLSREALRIKESDYQKLETLHKNIIESINSGLFTVNKDMKITFFNRAAEVITGRRLDQVYGRNVEEIFPGLLCAIEQASTHHTDGDGPRPRFEIPYWKNDIKKMYLGFSKSVLKEENGAEGGEVFTFQDVTRLKEMEEQVKMVDRLAAVGRLASGMAHEIRNPLASMSGSIQVLGQTLQLDDENKRLMDIVLRETHRLNQLLSDFVLFTHPDDRKKSHIELNAVVMDAIELFVSNPDHSAISVTTDLSGAIMVEADPHQIKQILWNLFINAFQAMQEGGSLRISTKVIPADSIRQLLPAGFGDRSAVKWVHIEVADTGCGIESEHLDKIFDPFFTTRPRGSGLGLAIVYSIVESYKGHITVKSSRNSGTSFSVFLPLPS